MRNMSFGTAFLCAALAMAAGNGLWAQSATMSLNEAVSRAAKEMENRLASGTKVAVLNFTSPKADFSDYIIDELTGVLVTNGKLTVIERKNLDLIRDEMHLQLSGNVSDDSAQSIGKQLGAQSIISGSLTELGDMYRLRVKAINVETAKIEAQVSFNLGNDRQITYLLYGNQPRPLPERRPSTQPQPAPAPQPAAAGQAGGSGIPAEARTKAGLYVGNVFQDSYDLSDSLEWIKVYARDGVRYTIALGDSSAVNNVQLDYGGKQVTVSLVASGGDMRAVRFGRNLDNPLFTVKEGVTFTLEEGVTLSGTDKKGNILVKVLSGGKFIMNAGALKENPSNAVSVDTGTFIMNGGTISGITEAAGVSVNGGTFTMTNGTISGISNSGVYVNGGTFTMTNGTIRGNIANDKGGGVWVNGNFTMNGGTISGNISRSDWWSSDRTGGGVYVNGTFTMTNGTINGNTTTGRGGGVFVEGTFTISGGMISGNTAGYGGGGGVWVTKTFTMNGGTISGNTAKQYGGGVHISDGTFTMNGGEIKDNTADANGGGVDVNGTFTIKDGTISGNTAKENGGGVYIGGSFTMSGGEISKNTASKNGGGVFGNKEIMLTGGTISGNTGAGGGGGVFGNGAVTMLGGTISGNTVTGNGGGVYGNNAFAMTGGVISGNIATGFGGGVYVPKGKSFTKSSASGIIYGSNAPAGQANKAISDESGHAVFVEHDQKRLRNATATSDIMLDSSKSKFEGSGWE